MIIAGKDMEPGTFYGVSCPAGVCGECDEGREEAKRLGLPVVQWGKGERSLDDAVLEQVR